MGSKQEYVAKEDLAPGQKVLYHPVGGSTQVTEGVIKEIITEPEVRTVRVDLVKIDCIDFNYFFGAHKQHAGSTQVRVQASEEEPRILIENLKTHKVSIQMDGSL